MAIAFDAQSASAFSATGSVTWSHTCTGSDRLLVVGVYDSADHVTGITYNGVAMTFINKLLMTGAAAGQYIYLYYLLNPASGANNVVASESSTDGLYGIASSYTGVKQSAQPDANNTQATSSATSLTTSLTTIANGAWIMGFAYGTTVVAGTNTILRTGPHAGLKMFDTNAAQTPAGSHSIQTTESPASFIGHVIASFAPVPSTFTPKVMMF